MNLDGLCRWLATERGPLHRLRQRAAAQQRRVLLPEADDRRVRVAAAALVQSGLAHPLLLRTAPGVPRIEPELATILKAEHWLDPRDSAQSLQVAEHLLARRRHRGLTQGQSHVLARDPLHLAASLAALGKADALVAGATWSTARVARAVLWCLGVAPDAELVSGAFLLLPPDSWQRCLMMADCAVVTAPAAEQLVQIAQATARSYHRLWFRWPSVALLSFSTRGSADQPAARKVATAARWLAEIQPDWQVVGEVQADAALVPEVARTKGIDWGECGQAEVLIFPDLASANIGQKLVERLGGWRAVGPLLQGSRRPVCALSRGCSALDIVDAVTLAILTAG